MKKEMSMGNARSLTEGSPLKLILGFALPMLFGLLFQQFYNMMDTIIVGRMLGVDALAAVGSTGSVNFMILGFCIGVSNGFSIPVAQRFGAGDDSSMRRFVSNSIWLCFVFAVIITVTVCTLCHSILVWMNTPDSILPDAYSYIIIIFAGIPVTFLYNMASGVLRALGDSKTPVVFLVLSSIINIILDILMIRPLGVAGAGYATVIAQCLSGFACLFYIITHFPILKMRPGEWKFRGQTARTLIIMGIPMGLQYSITAVGSVILQSAVNTLGASSVAAVSAATKTSMFFTTPYEALGSTMATYSGQNVGAGKPDRIDRGLKDAILLGFGYSVMAFAFLYFFGDTLALLYVNSGETVIIRQIHEFLIWNSAFFMALTLVNTVRFSIQGLGYSAFAIFSGVCEMFARTVGGLVLVPALGYFGACVSSPFAWICADLFLIPAYFHVMKKVRTRLPQPETAPAKKCHA